MTDSRKISIIVDLGREDEEDGIFNSLGRLRVPDGYQCEVIAIRAAASRVAAYREGCSNNNAKYKVYIDSKVRILADDFLCKAIKLFQMHEKIAVLDVSGNTVIPTNGICITGLSRTGGYLSDNQETFSKIEEAYREVAAVDGFMFATQYDLPWENNVFVNERFAITAQCIEYKKQGYNLAVLNQEEPSISLTDTQFMIDETERNKFLDMYSEIVYPKVLIGITTYNRPEYLQVALKSAMTQTYRNLEIVITDDSTNDETARIMPAYLAKDKRIKYYKQEDFTSLDNFTWLMRYIKDSPIEYINWLMDDDMLYPTKIEKMMTYYLEYDNISLVTSYRDKIDAAGNILQEYTTRPFEQDVIIQGREAGCKMLGECLNFVGEFSTTLLYKGFLREDVLFGWVDAIDWSLGLVDVSTWLQLCTKGDMVYIAEPLSAFRKHENQSQQAEATMRACLLHWSRLIKFAIDKNEFLTTDEEKRSALFQWCDRLYQYLAMKSIFIDSDREHENIIYRAFYHFMDELDAANVELMGWTGEQLEHAELPIKLKDKKNG